METVKTTGYAEVNGISMYYEIYGSGDIPLVLIHGGGSTMQTSFGNLIPQLAPHHKLIAVDLQAHGRTSDRNAPESFEQDADDVAALLKYLKVEKANIMGFSNGGTTALQIAIRHPQLVNKIIPVSANCRRDGMLAGLFDGLQNATLNDMPQILRTASLDAGMSQQQLQNMFNKDRERMLNFKDIADDDLQYIKAATLLMVAQHDVVLPQHVLAYSQLIAGSQVVVLPGIHGGFIGALESGVKAGDNIVKITADLIMDFLAQ